MACGPGEPITPAAFCSESLDQMQLIRAQLQTVASTADTLNNFNAITVTIAVKREFDYLADLALEAATLSTNITVPEEDRESMSTSVDIFDAHTSDMWTDALVMAGAMEDYAADQDANHLSVFVRRVEWFRQGLDLAEAAAFSVCLYANENNSG